MEYADNIAGSPRTRLLGGEQGLIDFFSRAHMRPARITRLEACEQSNAKIAALCTLPIMKLWQFQILSEGKMRPGGICVALRQNALGQKVCNLIKSTVSGRRGRDVRSVQWAADDENC